MAKKNVRQNIARLFEKLSIEILETFDTMSSQARLYRVFSYKQILERRRSAGLTFVLRNKGVLFCSPDGAVLLKSPAYVATPGDETTLRPARPRPRREPKGALAAAIRPSFQSAGSTGINSDEGDIAIISAATTRYWAVDEPALLQLMRSCRKVRPDARAEEIAFFAREKFALASQSRTITNPVGLVLATVPQSFVGKTFETFRHRLEQQRAHEAAEADRKAAEEDQITAWFTSERLRLESVMNDEATPELERSQAEKQLRRLAG